MEIQIKNIFENIYFMEFIIKRKKIKSKRK